MSFFILKLNAIDRMHVIDGSYVIHEKPINVEGLNVQLMTPRRHI